MITETPTSTTIERARSLPTAAVRALPAGATWRKALQITADAVVVAAAGLATRPEGTPLVLPLVLAPVVAVLVFARHRLYVARHLASRLVELRRLSSATVVVTLIYAFVAQSVQHPLPTAHAVALAGAVIGGAFGERLLLRKLFLRLRSQGRLRRPTVVVGNGDEVRSLVATLQDNPRHGHEVVGIITDDEYAFRGGDAPVPVVGRIADTERLLLRRPGTTVMLTAGAVDFRTANHLSRALQAAGLHVELSLGLRDVGTERCTLRQIGRHDMVYVEPHAHRGWRAVAKRSFDVVASGAILVVLAPALGVVAALVRFTSRGPILFRQERLGRYGQPFTVLKFRTMVEDAEARLDDLRELNEADGPLFKMQDDPRITPVGRVLRKLSLDELPQLLNVLRGDMSLVGPRPALEREALLWDEDVEDRLSVRPGITGMWQVSGRSNTSFDDYVRLDLHYVDNWSLLTDLWILAKTIPAVLKGDGAA